MKFVAKTFTTTIALLVLFQVFASAVQAQRGAYVFLTVEFDQKTKNYDIPRHYISDVFWLPDDNQDSARNKATEYFYRRIVHLHGFDDDGEKDPPSRAVVFWYGDASASRKDKEHLQEKLDEHLKNQRRWCTEKGREEAACRVFQVGMRAKYVVEPR